ncbi:MAG: pyrimidine dimer DNA glycosylase/endonuclease V [Candidatus Caldarchaeales archaeon]
MQVFRPYIDWRMSARVLDNRRLGKQRVEAKQVMTAILRRMGLIRDGRRGWLNHPITLMYYTAWKAEGGGEAGHDRHSPQDGLDKGWEAGLAQPPNNLNVLQ